VNTHDLTFQGSFFIPKGILKLGLRPHALLALIALLDLEDDFLCKSRGQMRSRWFFASNRQIRQKITISKSTLATSKQYLRSRQLIDYKPGYTGRATEYRILIDNFYHFEKAGQFLDNTKS